MKKVNFKFPKSFMSYMSENSKDDHNDNQSTVMSMDATVKSVGTDKLIENEECFPEVPDIIPNQIELDNHTYKLMMSLCVLTLKDIRNSNVRATQQLIKLQYCRRHFYWKLKIDESPFSENEINSLFYRLDDLLTTLNNYKAALTRLLNTWSNNTSLSMVYRNTVICIPVFHDCVVHFRKVHRLILHKGGPDVINDYVQMEIPHLDELFTDLIQFPVVMRSKIIYGIRQLSSYIPVKHSQYAKMKQAWRSCVMVNGVQNPYCEAIGHPLKSGYAIQVIKKKRFLRYLFLFPNNLIITSLTMKGAQGVFYESVDVIRIGKHMTNVEKSVNRSDYSYNEVLRNLKSWHDHRNILRSVTGKLETMFAPWHRMKIKLLERTISRKELTMIYLLPTLRLTVKDVINESAYHFIFSSHCELESWKNLIEENNYQYSELPVLLNHVRNFCQIPQVTFQKYMSNPFSYLDGVLKVHVHQVRELEMNIAAFITLQVDSFGGYFNKLFTTEISECSCCPFFDEIFEIPLNCSQHLKICLYTKHQEAIEFELFSTGIYDIWKASITSDYRLVTIPLFLRDVVTERIIPQISNPMDTLYTHKSQQRTVVALTLWLKPVVDTDSQNRCEIFGESLQIAINRDGVSIPLIVISCTAEIEKRGLNEEFLYLTKGNLDSIRRLFQAFDKCSDTGAEYIQNKSFTVHDIAQVLLWYLRALPTSLLQRPDTFILIHDIQNHTRKVLALRSLIHQLPHENRCVFFHLLDHFVKVCQYPKNKVTPTTAGKILFSVFYDLESADKLSEKTDQEMKFAAVMVYTMELRMGGVNLYSIS